VSASIPDDKIAEIKGACNIVHLISEYVALKKYGVNYRGLCPFHAENEPSFTVSEAKQIFHCFGCNTGGNVFTFLMKFEHLSFPEAVKKVGQKCGIALPSREPTPREKQIAGEKEGLFTLNELAASYYSGLLNAGEGEKARGYLAARHMTPESIRSFKLGYASPAWDGLLLHLKAKGASRDAAHKLGLVKRGKNNSWYDGFRNRIIFPIADYNGRIIGFSSRALDNDGAKYINSSDSLIYKKSASLFGLNAALPSIRKEDMAVLVEGNFDLVSLHQHGITNAVATLGTALTDSHIKLLKRFTGSILIAFDSDDAGRKAAMKSLPLFLQNGISPRMLELPAGTDPDSFINREKEAAFRELIDRSLPLVQCFITRALKKRNPANIGGTLAAIRETVPVLSLLKDDTERNLYIQKVSQDLNVPEQIIRAELSVSGRPAHEAAGLAAGMPDGRNRAEELLLQVMLLHPDLIPRVREAQILLDLKEPELKRIALCLVERFDATRPMESDSLINDVQDQDLKNIISGLVMKGECIIDPLKALTGSIQKIKAAHIEREIKLVNNKIREAEAGNDVSAIQHFLTCKQQLIEQKKACAADHASVHVP
jgi:DNA primase